MKLPSYFERFRSSIQPPLETTRAQQAAHWSLRENLAADRVFRPYFVNAFLQGSYKRDTAIAPGKDVDIVVVTSIDPASQGSWREMTNMLGAALHRLYGVGKVQQQTRSFCVTTEGVQLDVVVAASRHLTTKLADARRTSELENPSGWIDNPLLIPDRDLGRWVLTDPKAQLEFTTELNQKADGYFVPLVKIFKAWRARAYTEPKYPKGYLLERMAADCFDPTCSDDATGFVALLKQLGQRYRVHVLTGSVPHLSDPGVPSHNVLERLDHKDFATFVAQVDGALIVARKALDADNKTASANLWRQLLGDGFPQPPPFDASFPDAPLRPNKPAGFA